MADCGCEVDIEITNKEQRRLFIILLGINAFMFLLELITGLMAQSTGLVADSIDMFADAAVYSIALYAVGRSLLAKANAAYICGVGQILLAAGVAIDVTRRAIAGSDPESSLMMGIGTVALAANIICLLLIAKHREGEVHMRASWVFSKNDVLANLGVIMSGILVMLLDSRLPDLIIGGIITLIVLRGGILIVKDALNEKKKALSGKT